MIVNILQNNLFIQNENMLELNEQENELIKPRKHTWGLNHKARLERIKNQVSRIKKKPRGWKGSDLDKNKLERDLPQIGGLE